MILTVSLSPAWQRTLFFKSFHPGDVNRASRVLESAAGKGVNVARVVSTLGLPTCLLTVAGGQRGTLFRNALKTEHIRALVIPVKGETRLCETLLTPDGATEVVEEALPLCRREQAAFISAFSPAVKRASLVVLSGSVPRSCGNEFMARLALICNKQNVPVVADTQGPQLLHLMTARPALVKINRDELAAATGQVNLKRGARELINNGAGRIVISDGPGAVTAFSDDQVWSVTPPRIRVVNPIGSGDAMMAGIAVGLAHGKTFGESLNLGVACGTANALTEIPGRVNIREANRLLRSLNPAVTRRV